MKFKRNNIVLTEVDILHLSTIIITPQKTKYDRQSYLAIFLIENDA